MPLVICSTCAECLGSYLSGAAVGTVCSLPQPSIKWPLSGNVTATLHARPYTARTGGSVSVRLSHLMFCFLLFFGNPGCAICIPPATQNCHYLLYIHRPHSARAPKSKTAVCSRGKSLMTSQPSTSTQVWLWTQTNSSPIFSSSVDRLQTPPPRHTQPWVLRYRWGWQNCCRATLWRCCDKDRQTWWILRYSTSAVCGTPEARMGTLLVARRRKGWCLMGSPCRLSPTETTTMMTTTTILTLSVSGCFVVMLVILFHWALSAWVWYHRRKEWGLDSESDKVKLRLQALSESTSTHLFKRHISCSVRPAILMLILEPRQSHWAEFSKSPHLPLI